MLLWIGFLNLALGLSLSMKPHTGTQVQQACQPGTRALNFRRQHKDELMALLEQYQLDSAWLGKLSCSFDGVPYAYKEHGKIVTKVASDVEMERYVVCEEVGQNNQLKAQLLTWKDDYLWRLWSFECPEQDSSELEHAK